MEKITNDSFINNKLLNGYKTNNLQEIEDDSKQPYSNDLKYRIIIQSK